MKTRLSKSILASSLTLTVAMSIGTAGASPIEKSIQALGMDISSAEQAAIESAVNSSREISRRAEQYNGLPYRRDAHAKATACVRATFSINGDIPERFQHSVFSEPGKEYRAWVRFSNGDMLVQPDSKPDARGMAIKLMGIEGEPIAPELGKGGTQDFIMTNTPAFFNRNIYDYADDARFLAKFERTKWFISLFPPRLHPKQFYRAVQTISSRIDTPLAPQYYSMLPYQLGNTRLKFSTKPCPGSHYPKATDKNDPDFLTRQIEDTLADGAACFEFMVQPKAPGAYMPMDDATVIWSEEKSPFIPIARVRIPPQKLGGEPQRQFCENLSMNPWHGVGEWLPEGSLSRARRVVYNAVSEFRHEKNDVERYEPDNWCVPGAQEACTQDQGMIISKSRWPLPRCFDSLFQPLNGQSVNSECGGL
jgi:hypothetical protein